MVFMGRGPIRFSAVLASFAPMFFHCGCLVFGQLSHSAVITRAKRVSPSAIEFERVLVIHVFDRFVLVPEMQYERNHDADGDADREKQARRRQTDEESNHHNRSRSETEAAFQERSAGPGFTAWFHSFIRIFSTRGRNG